MSKGHIVVRVITGDDDFWITGFNGTLEAARQYFMGRRFERSDETLRAPVTTVIPEWQASGSCTHPDHKVMSRSGKYSPIVAQTLRFGSPDYLLCQECADKLKRQGHGIKEFE
jgi:hypothetical protein